VLIVAPFPLHPEGSAAARCLLGLIRGLALQGVDAQALTADSRREAVPPPPLDIAAERAYVDYPGVWRGRRDRLLAPYSVFARGDFGRRLHELSGDFDVVHLSGISGGAMVPLTRSPALVQLDNLTMLDRDLAPPWTRQGRIDLETFRAERTTRRRARWLLANSNAVAEELGRLATHAEVRRAPLSLDPDQYSARAGLTEPVAGLIGDASWPPTANAVRRLLSGVWPLVLDRRPSSRLLLAGRGMERAAFSDLPELAGVEWLGEVESAEAFLQGLGVLLYPLGRGSGAKIKVLESMLLGLPVVTTPPGAEGIDGPQSLIVETDDGALAGATCALLEDGEARRQTGEAIRRQFDAHHAPAEAAAAVVEVYEQMTR
jgi:hypothetical protein